MVAQDYTCVQCYSAAAVCQIETHAGVTYFLFFGILDFLFTVLWFLGMFVGPLGRVFAL